MRDRRFIACHRGGPLLKEHHRLLALWAADCAEHVLHLIEESQRDRPREAITIARSWGRGEAPVGAAQKAAVASHAAARACTSPAAVAAARAAGHAVATAHMAEHALGGALYAVKAVAASGGDVEAERRWHLDRLPPAIRDLVTDALNGERFAVWSGKRRKSQKSSKSHQSKESLKSEDRQR